MTPSHISDAIAERAAWVVQTAFDCVRDSGVVSPPTTYEVGTRTKVLHISGQSVRMSVRVRISADGREAVRTGEIQILMGNPEAGCGALDDLCTTVAVDFVAPDLRARRSMA